jgi:predicted dehydrogenase
MGWQAASKRGLRRARNGAQGVVAGAKGGFDMTEKIRWGILSTANIGMRKVIPGIQRSPHSVVTAIASRSLDSAKAAAAELGIAKAYGSYEELLADPDIDAVYNPLPNDLHVPLTLQAAQAGKHVLCEKPIALDAADAERLRAAPKDRLILEAFMVRFHPQWHRAREIVRSGELGEVRLVSGTFSYFNADPGNIRNDATKGGGGLMDIGCYPIVAARFLFEAEPRRVIALVDRDPAFATDRLASALLDFGDGRRLDFTASTQLVPFQSINVLGTKARLEILIPFNAPQGEPSTILIDDGASLDHSLARRETIAASDQYAEQAEAMALAILKGTSLPYGVEDAIQNMRILDALFASERSGGWIPLR